MEKYAGIDLYWKQKRMKRKLLGLKTISVICYLTAFFLLSFQDVHAAYIDPSVMTYAIQAIAGLAITLGTVIGLYWRKIRNLFFRNQRIASGNQESDHLEFRDPITNEVRSPKFREEKRPSAKKEPSEFTAAIALSFAMGFMLCFYAPLEIYFTNIFEFLYDFYGIIKYIVLLFLLVSLFILVGYFLFYKISKKAYYVLIVFGTIAFISFYIQGNFLIKDLPPTDGTRTDWSQFKLQERQSLILWIVVTAVCILLAFLLKKKFFQFTKIVTIGVTGVLLVTLISVAVKNNGFQHKIDICISNYGLDTLSADKNFVIFVVDSVDSKTFERLMNTEDLEYKEIFRDFTYYPDTLAAYPYTTLAVPHLMTGKWYECEEDYRTYFTEAMKASPLLNRLKEENYLGAIYSGTDVVFDDLEFLEYENLFERPYEIGSAKTFMLDELRLAFYLYMPYQRKKYEHFAIYNLQNEAPADYYYSWLDPWVYQYFDSHPIKLESEKRFRFIHIEGAHVPLRYDKNLNENYSTATYDSNTEACVTVLEKYLENLRESGAYDNTAIVILADHGYADKHALEGRENPLLLIKGWNESHEMETSDFPISYEYLKDIYQNMLDGKTGEDIIPDDADPKADRRYISCGEDDTDHLTEMVLPGGAKADEKEKLHPTGVQYSR